MTQDATWVGVVKAGGIDSPLPGRNDTTGFVTQTIARQHPRKHTASTKVQHGSATQKNAQLGCQMYEQEAGRKVGRVYLLKSDKRADRIMMFRDIILNFVMDINTRRP